jgi:uncharacterized membrane protein YhaH (DUF805 family)
MNPLAPVIAIVVPVALCIAEHYAPWRQWLGHPLNHFASYVLGSVAVFVPATLAALYATTVHEAIALFWVALVCAGVAVGVMRWNDNQRAEKLDLQDKLDRTLYGDH